MARWRFGPVVTAILAIIVPLAVAIIGATFILATRLADLKALIQSVHTRVVRIEKKLDMNGSDHDGLRLLSTRTIVG